MIKSVVKTILTIGADPLIIRLLEEVAVNYGERLRCDNVRDSQECLSRIKESHYDLIVTDTQTNGAEDVALLRLIRRESPATKVIVLASASTPTDVIEAMLEHAFSFFSVPFEPSEIAEMIVKALELPEWDDGIAVVSALPHWITLQVKCRLLTASRVVRFLREMRTELSLEIRERIGIAFREMLLNAIEHGGKFDPQQTIKVSCIVSAQALVYHIEDPGPGFSFDHLPHAAISNPADDPTQHILYRAAQELRAGGFGIMMTKDMVDELFYNEKGNEVLLIKHLVPPSDGPNFNLKAAG
jgi:two-component system, OmpR family, response regulator